MIECSKCGAKYPTERLFCGKCKERLGVRCAVCGFINLIDDLYCGICLIELSAQIQVRTDIEPRPEELVSAGSPLYNELLRGIEDDEAFAVTDEKIQQDEIDKIFQEPENENQKDNKG
jgi:hypothetical protein